MNFNEHWKLKDKHAFLSASQYHWLNYDTDKLITVYRNFKAKERGTKLHAFACEAIKLGIRLPRTKDTICRYVNDGIKYNMVPEQVLYYSDNCFGTADTVSFERSTLRIHDLKTGKTPASFHQLEIYAALFCLEYNISPEDIDIILRIYQLDDVSQCVPNADDIIDIMNKIIDFDNIINELRNEERL